MHISQLLTKVDIGAEKVDIEARKVDIQALIKAKLPTARTKSLEHIAHLYAVYQTIQYFGRMDAVKTLGLKPAMVSRLLKTMLTAQLIEPVAGKGKGKYRFSAVATWQ